jgi:hypothetical protein
VNGKKGGGKYRRRSGKGRGWKGERGGDRGKVVIRRSVAFVKQKEKTIRQFFLLPKYASSLGLIYPVLPERCQNIELRPLHKEGEGCKEEDEPTRIAGGRLKYSRWVREANGGEITENRQGKTISTEIQLHK